MCEIRKNIYAEDKLHITLSSHKDRINSVLGSPLIIGGSYNMYSPPIISSASAYVSGVEKIYLMVPSRIFDLARNKLDLIIYPFPDQKITKGVANKIIKLIRRKKISPSSILIGPGLTGIWRETGFLAYNISSEYSLPILIDKDAVKKEVVEIIKNNRNIILFINNKILFNVFGYSWNNADDLCMILKKLAGEYDVNILFLGEKTLVYLDKELSIIKSPVQLNLKYTDSYVFSGILTGLLSKSIPNHESVIISSTILIELLKKIRKELGIYYMLDDLMLYLKRIFKETFVF